MKQFSSFFTVLIVMFFTAIKADAQMIDQVDLESYAIEQYGSRWQKAAENVLPNYSLDNQGNMVFKKEISVPNLSRNELFVEMANWFICNYDSSIEFADKEMGVLIARPFIENIARYDAGFDAYDISIRPTVRVQILDGKVQLTYTLRDYSVVEEEGAGKAATFLAVGVAAAAVTAAVIADKEDRHENHHTTRTTVVDHYHYGYHSHTVYHEYREYRPRRTYDDALLLACVAAAVSQQPAKDSKTWHINRCYPFVAKDGHKKASSKAFIMANVYSQVVVNNIEAAVHQCAEAYGVN